MPTERTEVTAAALGGSIYVIGGFDSNGNTLDTVEAYETRSNAWLKAKELPLPLHHAAAASYQGTLYVVGGYREGWVPSNTLFIYDPLTNGWQTGKEMPTSRGALTAQFVDGILYAVGGSNGLPLKTNEAYDLSTNTWEVKEPMPTAREHLASGVVDGKLYVMGGRQGSLTTNLDVNEEYDPKVNKWATKAPMPSKRGGIAGASLPDSIFVFGGEAPEKTFDNNEQYVAAFDMWIVGESMPASRHGLAAVEAGGSIYVIGGGPQPGLSVSATNELFTPTDWRSMLNVDVKPVISIEPKNINVHDKVSVAVSLETNTAGYTVKFGEVSRTQKTFTADVTVIPPSPNAVVAQVITKHSHTYSLDGLEADDYRFVVLINGERRADAEIIVTPPPLIIVTPVDRVVEVSKRQQLILERSIENTGETKQPFIYILQVKDSTGVTISLSWNQGEMPPKSSTKISQSWIPESFGRYTLELFVWQSMDNPKVLAPMHAVTINVS